MTRGEFAVEFRRGMRFVIQKHDRVGQAAEGAAYSEAQTNLDAAIDQLADHVFDALEQMTPIASNVAGVQ